MINSKRTIKTLISLILIITMASSIWIGTGSAFIPGQSPIAPFNAPYVTFEGTAPGDQYSSMQYSYLVNQWAVENYVYNSSYYIKGNPSEGHLGITPGTVVSNSSVIGSSVFFSATKSLRVGMTEFGEFATPGYTGIAYGANEQEFNNTESWASLAINQAYMVQGWDFYMNYTRFGVQRAIEAYAKYSDSVSQEAARKVWSWDPLSADVSSGVTAGTLTPTGIEILYDSESLGVARVTTVITDGFYHEAVAQVTETLIYDKTSKLAIVYYDVKIVLAPKVLDSISDFVFQKQYEIDLAALINPSNNAYVHYFSNYTQSCYQDPLTGNYSVDVVQAYNAPGSTTNGNRYIFFDAIYPMASSYSVYSPLLPTIISTTTAGGSTTGINPPGSGETAQFYGFTRLLPYNTHIADIPLPVGEPNTPLVIINWNYTQAAYPKLTTFLAKSLEREIRFVDVFGMTDYNNDPTPALQSSDPAALAYNLTQSNEPNLVNQVDAEIQYLISTVFNPIDLTTLAYPNEVSPADTGSPLWVAVGQGSAATDSAGAAAVSAMWLIHGAPLGLFDINDTTHLGSIPYGLNQTTSANDGITGYIQTLNNKIAGIGNDNTNFQSLGLINYAWGIYDEVNAPGSNSTEPVSGGFSQNFTSTDGSDFYTYAFWSPSKNPLTERWVYVNLTVGGTLEESYWELIGYTSEDARCITWSPNGIITIGGNFANGITRYFNDFNFAIEREGTSSTDYSALLTTGAGMPNIAGAAPTNIFGLGTVDFYPLSTWNTSSWNTISSTTIPVVNTVGMSPDGTIYSNWYGPGTAIIAVAVDVNGTRGITVAGWNAEDTYWASAWASQYLNGPNNAWVPCGAVAIVLQMSYPGPNAEPTFNIARVLGTITEFGSNTFYLSYGTYDLAAAQTASGQPDRWTMSPSFNSYYDSSELTENLMFGDLHTLGLSPPTPAYPVEGNTWWFEKLPTTSTASIEYDS